MTREKTILITIDNRKVKTRQNQTILNAARENDIYIPSLCALEHLPSYGACRLCVVEVDGIRGYPTSCTTPVEEGMVIRTDTAELRTLRQEVLKLMLSEHPASCLFCDEQKECKTFMGTIRKVGVTTGCRYCPNDTRCELQTITEKVGLTETSYPVYYRGFEVEKNDPFYDRDYNLCILCGRCVRVCNDIRLNGTLSFKQRGKQTIIGPAFDRTHLDAGCEFCGACVSVCPTGALSVKVSKWYGTPDNVVATTCSYCPVGCELLLQVKNGEVIDVLPDYDSDIDGGIICVKGRFAVPEYIHSASRLTAPQRLTPIGYEDISWDQAVGEAAERLAGMKPDDFLMVVSPHLTNEELFAAQKFTREVMKSDNIASTVMMDLGDSFGDFLDVVTNTDHYDSIADADLVLAIGFDGTYDFSPVGMAVKKAVRNGARFISIHAKEVNFDMISDISFTALPRKWASILGDIVKGAPGGKAKTTVKSVVQEQAAAVLVAQSAKKVFIIGPDVLGYQERSAVFDFAVKHRGQGGWKTIVLHPYTNLSGMLVMGALPGTKPGAFVQSGSNGKPRTLKKTTITVDLRKRRRVIYLVGEIPDERLPDCDYLIYQNGIRSDTGRSPDLVLPASILAESPGTFINAWGLTLPVRKAVDSPGDAKPDWWILGKIGEKLVKGKLKYGNLSSVQNDIKGMIQGFAALRKKVDITRIVVDGSVKTATRKSATGRPESSRYRGVALAEVVSGMKTIEEKKGRKSP